MTTPSSIASLLTRFRSVLSHIGVQRQAPIAVALSGGSDSLALALLTTWWHANQGPPPPPPHPTTTDQVSLYEPTALP